MKHQYYCSKNSRNKNSKLTDQTLFRGEEAPNSNFKKEGIIRITSKLEKTSYFGWDCAKQGAPMHTQHAVRYGNGRFELHAHVLEPSKMREEAYWICPRCHGRSGFAPRKTCQCVPQATHVAMSCSHKNLNQSAELQQGTLLIPLL